MRTARGGVSTPAHIRVGVLLHTVAYGGIETIVLNWLKTISPERFTTYLFCFANPGNTEAPFVEAATRAGFPVYRLPWGRRKPLVAASRALSHYIRAFHIEIVHAHNPYADMVTAMTKWRTGVKILTTLYVSDEIGWKRQVLEWLNQWVLRTFDQVTAQSEDALRATIARGIPRAKTRVLPSGYAGARVRLAPAERDRRRAALGAQPEDVVLINIARFWPEKAHDDLLRAFRAIVAASHRCACGWRGSGRARPRSDSWRVPSGSPPPACNFWAFGPTCPNYWPSVDMQVHPSLKEGIPLALCCGMAVGLPIVATRVGGVPEILSHNETAILVAPRQPHALAQAVLDLLAAPTKRQTLGNAVRPLSPGALFARGGDPAA